MFSVYQILVTVSPCFSVVAFFITRFLSLLAPLREIIIIIIIANVYVYVYVYCVRLRVRVRVRLRLGLRLRLCVCLCVCLGLCLCLCYFFEARYRPTVVVAKSCTRKQSIIKLTKDM